MVRAAPWNPVAGINPIPEPNTPPPPPLINQVIATVDDPQGYLILADRLTWFLTHWHEGRTGPHVEPPIRCKPCQEGCSGRRYAYLPVLDVKRGSARIYQLTERGVQYSPTLQAHKQDLRGRQIRGFRLGKGKERRNAPASYHVGALKQVNAVPDSFDLVFHLLRLWGYGHLYREWVKMGAPENVPFAVHPDVPSDIQQQVLIPVEGRAVAQAGDGAYPSR